MLKLSKKTKKRLLKFQREIKDDTREFVSQVETKEVLQKNLKNRNTNNKGIK